MSRTCVTLLVLVASLLLSVSLALRQESSDENGLIKQRAFRSPKHIASDFEGAFDMHRHSHYQRMKSVRRFYSPGSHNGKSNNEVDFSTYVSMQQSGLGHIGGQRSVLTIICRYLLLR